MVHATTYALWEQLYSPSFTSLSLERLMYLRATSHDVLVSGQASPAPPWVTSLWNACSPSPTAAVASAAPPLLSAPTTHVVNSDSAAAASLPCEAKPAVIPSTPQNTETAVQEEVCAAPLPAPVAGSEGVKRQDAEDAPAQNRRRDSAHCRFTPSPVVSNSTMSVAVAASPELVVCLTGTAAAVLDSETAHTSLSRRQHDDENCSNNEQEGCHNQSSGSGGDGSSPQLAHSSTPSSSPLVDRDGLVFSPPRRRQMQQRLQRRRRQREPSVGGNGNNNNTLHDVSSSGTSPLSPAPQPPSLPIACSDSATPPPPPPPPCAREEDGDDDGASHVWAAETVQVNGKVNRAATPLQEEEQSSGEEAAVLGGRAMESSVTLPEVPSPFGVAESEAPTVEFPRAKIANDLATTTTFTAETSHNSSSNALSELPLEQPSSPQPGVNTVHVEATSATAPRAVQMGNARVTDHDNGENSTAVECVCASGSCSGAGVSRTPTDIRHTAAAIATTATTADSVDSQERSVHVTEAFHERSTSSASPAPRRTSPSPFPATTSFPPEASSPSQDGPQRRSISTLNFAWATEAEDALRRQQRRLFSHSLAKGCRSPNVTHRYAQLEGSTYGKALLVGPQVYRPLPEGTIGLLTRSVSAEAPGSPTTWSVSPQPQDPRVRFGPTASAETIVSIAPSPPPRSVLTAVNEAVASPVRFATSLLSSSQQPWSPRHGRREGQVSGEKRTRDPHNDASDNAIMAASRDNAKDASREQRTTGSDAFSPYSAASMLGGSSSGRDKHATTRRGRTRLNASASNTTTATATAASVTPALVNEFVLPRTVSTEPVSPVAAATDRSASSPLQPCSVNRSRHRGGVSSASPSLGKTGTTTAYAAVSPKRKVKTAKKADQQGQSGKAVVGRRKPSIVALNQKRRWAKQSKEN